MEALLVLLLALGLRGGKAQADQQNGETPVAGGAPPPDKGADDLSGLGNVVKDVVGISGAVIGAVTGSVGTATAGTVAATAGTAATAGSTVATTGTTTTTATATTQPLTTAAVGLSAGGAGALVIVGIAALFVIAKEIVKAQEKDKDWQQLLLGLNANGQALNEFELNFLDAVLAAFPQNLSTGLRLVGPVESVVDPRLEGPVPFSTQVRGRGYFRFRRMMGGGTDDPRIWRAVRGLAYEWMFWRANYGYRLVRNWTAVRPEPDWGMTFLKRSSLYDNDTAGLGRIYRADDPGNTIFGPLGGLDNIPSAANGRTVVPRANGSEELPASLELIGDGNFNVPGEVPERAKKLMRLRGLIACLATLRNDPRPSPGEGEADRAAYAEMVWRGLRVGWISDTSSAWVPAYEATGIQPAGRWLELDADLFGAAAKVDPSALRRAEPGAWKVEGLR